MPNAYPNLSENVADKVLCSITDLGKNLVLDPSAFKLTTYLAAKAMVIEHTAKIAIDRFLTGKELGSGVAIDKSSNKQRVMQNGPIIRSPSVKS